MLARAGKGLPQGPAGLLGAVEGFSYLSLLAGKFPSHLPLQLSFLALLSCLQLDSGTASMDCLLHAALLHSTKSV